MSLQTTPSDALVDVAANLATVNASIAAAARAAGRDPAEVTLVAVSKTKPAALIARANQTYVCIAGSVAGRRHVMDAGIRPLRRDWRFAGPAVTVAAEEAVDTLTSQVATQLIEPGDVIVVEACGRMDRTASSPPSPPGTSSSARTASRRPKANGRRSRRRMWMSACT